MMVVVAGLLERDGRLLVSQRRPGQHQGMRWEFPGGKLEKGESPEQALERELEEELGVKTRAEQIAGAIRHDFGDRDILILYYRVSLLKGDARAIDANAIAWAGKSELAAYDLGDADREFATRFL